MTPAGFRQTKPIADNRTEDGRAKGPDPGLASFGEVRSSANREGRFDHPHRRLVDEDLIGVRVTPG